MSFWKAIRPTKKRIFFILLLTIIHFFYLFSYWSYYPRPTLDKILTNIVGPISYFLEISFIEQNINPFLFIIVYDLIAFAILVTILSLLFGLIKRRYEALSPDSYIKKHKKVIIIIIVCSSVVILILAIIVHRQTFIFSNIKYLDNYSPGEFEFPITTRTEAVDFFLTKPEVQSNISSPGIWWVQVIKFEDKNLEDVWGASLGNGKGPCQSPYQCHQSFYPDGTDHTAFVCADNYWCG